MTPDEEEIVEALEQAIYVYEVHAVRTPENPMHARRLVRLRELLAVLNETADVADALAPQNGGKKRS